MSSEQGLSTPQMARLTAEVRGATRRLSAEQMLDLADMLHEVIRARRRPGLKGTAHGPSGAGWRSGPATDA